MASLLTYNTYLIPSLFVTDNFSTCVNQSERAKEIATISRDYDVVCLQEVWGYEYKEFKKLRKTHKVSEENHSSILPWKFGKALDLLSAFLIEKNGGLYFAMKKTKGNILYEKRHVFENTTENSLSKGVKIALVDLCAKKKKCGTEEQEKEKEESGDESEESGEESEYEEEEEEEGKEKEFTKLLVINTHLEAANPLGFDHVRYAQVGELHKFIGECLFEIEKAFFSEKEEKKDEECIEEKKEEGNGKHKKWEKFGVVICGDFNTASVSPMYCTLLHTIVNGPHPSSFSPSTASLPPSSSPPSSPSRGLSCLTGSDSSSSSPDLPPPSSPSCPCPSLSSPPTEGVIRDIYGEFYDISEKEKIEREAREARELEEISLLLEEKKKEEKEREGEPEGEKEGEKKQEKETEEKEQEEKGKKEKAHHHHHHHHKKGKKQEKQEEQQEETLEQQQQRQEELAEHHTYAVTNPMVTYPSDVSRMDYIFAIDRVVVGDTVFNFLPLKATSIHLHSDNHLSDHFPISMDLAPLSSPSSPSPSS